MSEKNDVVASLGKVLPREDFIVEVGTSGRGKWKRPLFFVYIKGDETPEVSTALADVDAIVHPRSMPYVSL